MVYLQDAKALPGGIVFNGIGNDGYVVSLQELKALEIMPEGTKFYRRSKWFVRTEHGFKVGELEFNSIKDLLAACKAAKILQEN